MLRKIIFLASLCVALAQYDFGVIDSLIEEGIQSRTFPGATFVIGDSSGTLFKKNYGRFTYDKDSTPIIDTTLFDLASVTKVLSTTSAVATFFQRGELDLGAKISAYFPEFAANGKGEITVQHLLLHDSGLPPDPYPNYWQAGVGCPETAHYHPAQSFSCQEIIYNNLMNQRLQNPIGQKYVYSDLSMITLMYLVGLLAKQLNYVTDADVRHNCPISGGKGHEPCYYEAYVRKHLFEKLNMKNTCFIPRDKKVTPPAWNDTYYRHEIIQGYVSDENAYAMGGIAGHAGMFSTAMDVELMLRSFLLQENSILNSTTMSIFSQAKNTSQSSRALGWDTMMTGDLPGWCGTLSRSTYLHLGYSGTEVCLDPVRKLYTIFFTNRSYPEKENFNVSKYRRLLNSKVQEIIDGNGAKGKIFEYIVVAVVVACLLMMIGSVAVLIVFVVVHRKRNYQRIIE